MSSPASPSPRDRSPLSISESSTAGVSSPLDRTSPPLVMSPSTTSSPKASSLAATPPRSRRDSFSTVREYGLSASASHPLPAQASLSASPIYSSALSLPGHLGDSGGSSFRSRSRSPLGKIDDTITKWRNDDPQRASDNKTLLGWWTTNEHKGKNLELQEPVPGWQQIKTVSTDEMRIYVAFTDFAHN